MWRRYLQIGVRVLNKVARSNVGDLIRRLDHNSTKPAVAIAGASGPPRAHIAVSDTEAQANAVLLSSLALEEENVEKIVAAGGVHTLIRSLSNQSKVSCWEILLILFGQLSMT